MIFLEGFSAFSCSLSLLLIVEALLSSLSVCLPCTTPFYITLFSSMSSCVFDTAVEDEIFMKRAPDGGIGGGTFQCMHWGLWVWRKRFWPLPKLYSMMILWLISCSQIVWKLHQESTNAHNCSNWTRWFVCFFWCPLSQHLLKSCTEQS